MEDFPDTVIPAADGAETTRLPWHTYRALTSWRCHRLAEAGYRNRRRRDGFAG